MGAVEPGSPAFAGAGVLNQAALRPMLPVLQNVHGPSRFAPTATGGADSCSGYETAAYTSLGVTQMHNAPLSYTSANAALVADASMLAAATAAVCMGSHGAHDARLPSHCTPLACSRVGPLVRDVCGNSHLGAVASAAGFMGGPKGQQQGLCLLATGAAAADMGSVGAFGTSTPTYGLEPLTGQPAGTRMALQGWGMGAGPCTAAVGPPSEWWSACCAPGTLQGQGP